MVVCLAIEYKAELPCESKVVDIRKSRFQIVSQLQRDLSLYRIAISPQAAGGLFCSVFVWLEALKRRAACFGWTLIDID